MRGGGWPALVALLLAALGPAAAGPEGIPQGAVPCADPRGCPDLVVDGTALLNAKRSTQTFAPDHCAVQEGLVAAGARELLRFDTSTQNLGDGAFILGAPGGHPDWYEWGACHGHWHLKHYAAYRLWTPDGFLEWDRLRRENPDQTASEVLAGHPELEASLVSAAKRAFCVIDFRWARPHPEGLAFPPDPAAYDDCFFQGLGRGWADLYDASLDGQWVDVTDAAPGAYVLEVEVNPERFIQESDPTDGRSWVPLRLDG